MLYQRNELKTESREKVWGGNGIITLLHMAEGKGTTQKNINQLSEITMPSGASIGLHSHTEDTEFYIILKGKGVVDDNGTEKSITEGDVMITGNGETHSIANTGNVPLVFYAIIIKN
jgi:mannose-6-phosphate isomerase-like protein (cupin superfamily)